MIICQQIIVLICTKLHNYQACIQKVKKLYPQIYLDDCFYKSQGSFKINCHYYDYDYDYKNENENENEKKVFNFIH